MVMSRTPPADLAGATPSSRSAQSAGDTIRLWDIMENPTRPCPRNQPDGCGGRREERHLALRLDLRPNRGSAALLRFIRRRLVARWQYRKLGLGNQYPDRMQQPRSS